MDNVSRSPVCCWGLDKSPPERLAVGSCLCLGAASPAEHREVSGHQGMGNAPEKCLLISQDKYNGIIQIDLLRLRAPGLFPLPGCLTLSVQRACGVLQYSTARRV